MTAAISLAQIDAVTGGRLGRFDTTCPLCTPFRHSPANRRAKVLRVWRVEAGFATYYCVHCGEAGFTHDREGAPPDPERLARARAEAAERDRIHRAERLGKAHYLWAMRKPIAGSVAETYLRKARGYGGPLPATLGFLPARNGYPPALIGAFGMAHEMEPGQIAIADVALRGVQVTRLQPDGSGKATFENPDEKAKISVGLSAGWPMVLAPPNDLLGLAITAGIEDGLTVFEETGLGVWAVGGAKRMPALAERLPAFIDCVTVVTDDDADGRRFAGELVERIEARGIQAIPMILGRRYCEAA
jgi:hypothetical protein